MTTDCRYIFMGTPAFAVTVLDHAVAVFGKPLLVLTQADKPVGRKAVWTPSEVKQYALDKGFGVMTPERLSANDVLETVSELDPHLIITAAYGKLVPPALLALPQHGCLNVHASLLPKYRGASPISAAILAGDEATGVTIMQMDQGLDTGPILSQVRVPIAETDRTDTLSAKLAQAAGPLLAETVAGVLDGTCKERAQKEDEATYTTMLSRRDGALDFSRSAIGLDRHVRAMMPWPRAYTRLRGKTIKVERAAYLPETHDAVLPGTIVGLDHGIDIACGDGTLRLLDIVPAGRKKMEARALAHNLQVGESFDVLP